MAVIVIGAAGLYYHQHLKAGREFEEYRLAAQSNDINVVEQYLKAFPDAPQQHINAINARKGKLLREEQDWKNALASQSTSIVQHYIDTHQDGRFLEDALGQLDSLDWETSKMADSDSAYQKYLEKHPDGKYFNEAEEAIRAIKNRIVTPEETLLVRQIFRQFFLAINEKNEAKLAAMVNNILSTFLGKSGATKTDVLDFMKRMGASSLEELRKMPAEKLVNDKQYLYPIDYTNGFFVLSNKFGGFDDFLLQTIYYDYSKLYQVQ